MEYRHLGRSGLMVSEIAYGNWITHGDQVEEQAATDCVRAALDEDITTFDTADAYAGGRAEEVLGRALHGVRRESLEIFTKVYWPTGDKPNDRGLSRKHITESLHASLRRLQTDYVDLYQAHRYDYETPIRRDHARLRRPGPGGQGAVRGRVRVARRGDRGRAAGGRRARPGPDRANQPQYNIAVAGHRARGRAAAARRKGIGQLVFSPIAQGILTGKYEPGTPPRRTPGPPRRLVRASSSAGSGTTRSRRCSGCGRWLRRPACSLAQLAVAWTLQNQNVSAAIVGATRPAQVHENVKAAGVSQGSS